MEQSGEPGRQVFGTTGTSALHSSNTPAAPHSFKPPRMRAQCPHRYPDPANRENSRVLKEKSHQARQDSPQAPWAVPFLPAEQYLCHYTPREMGTLFPRTPTWGQSGDMAVQEPPHRSEVKAALGRSQQASCCPRHGDKLPSEPPSQSAPATQSPPDSPTPFSAPAQTSHPTNPPTQQGDHPPLHVPTQERLWHPCSPHCCCPTPLHGTHPAQWGQGLGREATQTVLRAFNPVLGFLLGLSHSLCPSLQTASQHLLSVLACRGGSSRLHPSPVLGAEELMPCAKNCCRGQGRTEATAKKAGGVSALCPKMRTREQIPLIPIRCVLFHPSSTFGVSMTPPGKGQGPLQGDSAAL